MAQERHATVDSSSSNPLADTVREMIGRTLFVLALAVLATACGPDVDVGVDIPASTSASTPTTTRSDTATSTTSLPESSMSLAFPGAAADDDVVEFVAAVDELLAETAYADAVFDAPEVFVATGWLLCDELKQGIDPAQALTVYIETITGDNIDAADDDTLVLAGTLLGTAVGYLCPATVALMAASSAGAAADEKATGLERAAQATMQGLEKSQGKAGEAPGQANRAKGHDKQNEKTTGRDRAAQAIDAAIARGNGEGKAWGRGHAPAVLADLEIENHGEKAREMVHAYNALRKE